MQQGFYLRLTEGEHTFLLAREQTVSVEPRDQLQRRALPEESWALAWLTNDENRWPVVRLAELLGYAAGEWGDAVFMRSDDHVVGIAVESVQQLDDLFALDIRPFSVIGGLPGTGPIYSGVCIDGRESTLVFDYRGLCALVEEAINK